MWGFFIVVYSLSCVHILSIFFQDREITIHKKETLQILVK